MSHKQGSVIFAWVPINFLPALILSFKRFVLTLPSRISVVWNAAWYAMVYTKMSRHLIQSLSSTQTQVDKLSDNLIIYVIAGLVNSKINISHILFQNLFSPKIWVIILIEKVIKSFPDNILFRRKIRWQILQCIKPPLYSSAAKKIRTTRPTRSTWFPNVSRTLSSTF